MSDDTHIDGHNEEMDFEREDLTPKPILLFLLALIVGCVLVALVLRGMYGYLESYDNHHQPVQSPLVPQSTADTRYISPNDIAKFPEPRLESNERSEINDFRIGAERPSHAAADRDSADISCEYCNRGGAEGRYKR